MSYDDQVINDKAPLTFVIKKDLNPTTPSKFRIMMLKSSAYPSNDKIAITIKT